MIVGYVLKDKSTGRVFKHHYLYLYDSGEIALWLKRGIKEWDDADWEFIGLIFRGNV